MIGQLPGVGNVQAQVRTWSYSALAVRLVVLLAGLAVLLIPGEHRTIPIAAVVVGIAIAVLSPDRGGPAFAVAAGIGGWFAGFGVHGSPPALRVLGFAFALYLLLSSTALAAAVPLTARLERRAALRWALRWLGYAGVAGLFAAISYGIDASIEGYGSYPVELAGLAGAVAVVGCAVWLFTRSPR
ncbi:MAG TPA: hypothetical protein VFD94_08150 [Jatrophihabitans sp.]|jgi:hypothetical protein|nr:hypothetical protein [Jatrophihabitans sp.]